METISAIFSAAERPLRGDIYAISRLMAGADGDSGSRTAGSGSDSSLDEPARRRVLVADDETAIRSLITTFLTRAGYDVAHAEDGQEAIDLLQSGSYDAVVTDLMMPRVDGVGVVRYIQKNHPELLSRTIVLTAYPRLAESESIEKLCSVIAKPFELANLRGVLKSMFDDVQS